MKELFLPSERGRDERIKTPKSKVLLFDLDNTLINQQYQITDGQVLAEIQRVQDLGWTLGLSSDTPLEPLEVWRNRLGFNGPIIAERGALIKLASGEDVVTVENSETFFQTLKGHIVDELTRRRINFFYGDVTQFIRNNPTLRDMVDKRIVLVQAYRRCSLNFFGRRLNSDDQLEIDNELTASVVDITKAGYTNPPFALAEDFNPDYGIYILSSDGVNKRMGTLALMQHMGIQDVGMVGDSGSDFIGNDIAMHYAVGNAKEVLKSAAVFTAKTPHTQGVTELLRLIV